MKATLLTWALPLLFAGAAVAQGLVGHIVGGDKVNCRSCPTTNCQSQIQYNKGDIVALTCTTNVNTENRSGDVWWVKTGDGCYTTDVNIEYIGGVPPIC